VWKGRAKALSYFGGFEFGSYTNENYFSSFQASYKGAHRAPKVNANRYSSKDDIEVKMSSRSKHGQKERQEQHVFDSYLVFQKRYVIG